MVQSKSYIATSFLFPLRLSFRVDSRTKLQLQTNGSRENGTKKRTERSEYTSNYLHFVLDVGKLALVIL